MAVFAAANVVSLNADVVCIDAAISPPLGRAKNSDDRCLRCNSNMRRACVAADINGRLLREPIESFQTQLCRNYLSRPARRNSGFSQRLFSRPAYDHTR